MKPTSPTTWFPQVLNEIVSIARVENVVIIRASCGFFKLNLARQYHAEPQELSTLMLVKDAPEQVETDRVELGVLCVLQLIEIGPPEAGLPMPRITSQGAAVLRAIARLS